MNTLYSVSRYSMEVNDQLAHEKVKISRWLGIYIIYSLFLLNSDILCLVLYYCGLNSFKWIGVLLGGLFTCLLIFVFRKRFQIEKYRLDVFAYCIIAFIILLGFVRGILPDTSSDVVRAHIFFQQIGFEDNLTYNFFPAGYSFYFYLADELFYLPRLIFGYRLGAFFNTIVLILTYCEIRQLLIDLFSFHDERNSVGWKKIKVFCISLMKSESLWAGIATLTFFAVSELGTYMMDLIAIPVVLFIIRMTLKERDDCMSFQFGFYAFLCGLCFSYKQTGIVIILPCLLMYIIKHRKRIAMLDFFKSTFIGIVPSAPYLLYTFISTGNPVFPYYNAFFRSPYFLDQNFKDMRWGPLNIKNYFSWPFRLVYRYTERISEIINMPLIYILLGFICLFLMVLFYREIIVECSKYLRLSILFVVGYILWMYTTGYLRYAIIIEILAVLLVAIIVKNSLLEKNIFRFMLALCLSLSVLFQSVMINWNGIMNNYDWSWRGNTMTNLKDGIFSENLKWLFRDRKIGSDEQAEKVDLFVDTIGNNMYMTLLNSDPPIIGVPYIQDWIGNIQNYKGINYKDKYQNIIFDEIRRGKGVYDICPIIYLESLCESANGWNLGIADMESVSNFFGPQYGLCMVKYKISTGKNEISDLPFGKDIPLFRADSVDTPKGFLFFNANYYSTEAKLDFIIKDKDNNVRERNTLSLSSGDILNIEDILRSSVNDKNDRIFINIPEGSPTIYVLNSSFDV